MIIRPVKEIQRAHDLIIPILLGEIPAPFENPEAMLHLHAAADVLCWVLQHDHNTAFTKNLANLENGLREQGFILEDHGN